jgi:hypothetical protein
MTYNSKLKQWVEDEKKKGLVDIKIYPGNRSKASVESFSASILGFTASREQNRRTRITKL